MNFAVGASSRNMLRGLTMLSRCAVAVSACGLLLLAGCERKDSVQRGYRGVGMVEIFNPSTVAAAATLHSIPEPEPTDPPEPDAPPVSEVFSNIKVLNDLSALELSRLMQAMSTWVSPEEGCDFCHNPDKLESDEKYPKIVARRMLLMTRDINANWKDHVGATGVTCWTCHRGQAVPSGDWFERPPSGGTSATLGNRAKQNTPGVQAIGNAALPYDPLSVFLVSGTAVPIQGRQALAGQNNLSIKQAEWTYSLMMYMSNSLGVNCTFCHNTRAMGRWEESTPQRATAWHGIRMVRALNTQYLIPLKPDLPVHRLSPEGDGPKVGCETCHKGVFKPLNGISMLPDYPELAGVMKDRPVPVAAASPAKVSEAAAAPAR